MDLGIIEAGIPAPQLVKQFGSYGEMFRCMLGPDHSYTFYRACEGRLPWQQHHHAYLITGSASSVHDEHLWIASLKLFIQQVSNHAPLVGICFGHQIIAEAYGGRVARSAAGWGIGLHTYEIRQRVDWMIPYGKATLRLPVSHRDQIIEPPSDAVVLGGSAFTPFAILEYPQRNALSLQPHPEFSVESATALINLRRGAHYQQEFADDVVRSLDEPSDVGRASHWIRNFLARPAK